MTKTRIKISRAFTDAKESRDDLDQPNGAKRRIALNVNEGYTDKDTQVSQPQLPRSTHPHFFDQFSLCMAKLVLIRELLAEIGAKTVILLRMKNGTQAAQ
jgi:hypothetical protein